MADNHSLELLVQALKRLPGVGVKSAQRMAFHLLQHDRDGALQLAQALQNATSSVRHCTLCHTFTEGEICTTCADGYNPSGDICSKKPADDGMSTIVIIIIGVGVLLGLSIGGYFIVKMIRKQRGKKVQTLLES